VVHSLIEKYKDKQFILTGSSARKIKRKGVDLLAGRAVIYNLYPFMAKELGNLFSFQKVLHYGLIPLVWMSQNPQDTLNAYCGLYLKEEVQMEALVRNIGSFSRFLEAVSFSHAQVLNISNVSRECEVGRKTVEGYIEILEDLLLSFKVPVFKKRAKRALIEHPKFYFFDTGIFRALRPKGFLNGSEELDGLALEGLVAQHLRTWISYRRKENFLYYWRTHSGVEVDFIVYGEDGLWAVEVKNASKINSIDLRALKSFKEDYPVAKTIFLYRGKERLKKQGILCIPCEEFLLQLHPEKELVGLVHS
jgi:predicted AAA+ superfamily ATPase